MQGIYILNRSYTFYFVLFWQALTHLFVSRFISHFLHGQNLLKHPEPFKRFIAIGMVKGESFRTKTGKYVEPKHVEKRGDEYFSVDCGEKLERNVEKMSKSKLNGVDPEDIVKTYGIDFTRLFILGFVHPRSDRDFLCEFDLCRLWAFSVDFFCSSIFESRCYSKVNKDMVDGTLNLLRTVWDLVGSVVKSQTKATIDNLKSKKTSNTAKLINDEEMYRVRNSNLATVCLHFIVYVLSMSQYGARISELII
jgi:leucyl-tRNA synthetase